LPDIVEGDVGPQGPADQRRTVQLQGIQKFLEVPGEVRDGQALFGDIRVAVSPQIEGDNLEMAGQFGDLLPEVAMVGRQAMDEHNGPSLAPGFVIQAAVVFRDIIRHRSSSSVFGLRVIQSHRLSIVSCSIITSLLSRSGVSSEKWLIVQVHFG
jgi:hypothetical protein